MSETDEEQPLPDETHPPGAADREGATALRIEEEEKEEEENDEDVLVIAAEQALLEKARDDEAPVDEPEPPAEVWTPVDDVSEADLELHEDATPAPEAVWSAVDDGDAEDTALDEVRKENLDDPWGPVDPALHPVDAPPPPTPLREAPHPLPKAPPRPAPVVPRVIPWRTVVTPSAPDLGRVVLTADPTRPESSLCVSSWVTTGPNSVQVRVAGDGPAVVLETEQTDPPVVHAAVVVAGFPLEVPLQVRNADEVVGIVLGRDALAGRFVVDAALQTSKESVREPRD